MPWELGGLAAWVALVTAVGAGRILAGNVAEVAALILVPTILVPVGAVQLMKLANRRAQRRIAAGELPGLMLPNASRDTGTDPVRADDSMV